MLVPTRLGPNYAEVSKEYNDKIRWVHGAHMAGLGVGGVGWRGAGVGWRGCGGRLARTVGCIGGVSLLAEFCMCVCWGWL